MLYSLLEWLNTQFSIPGFGVFQYLTFRAVLAAIFSLLLSLIVGKRIIRYLRSRLIGERIRDLGPESHKSKQGTPTMGGIIILLSISIPTLLWADLSNLYVILALLATLWMGVVGFLDDYIKVFRKDKKGLRGKYKIYGQLGLGLLIGFIFVSHPQFQGSRNILNGNQIRRATNILKQNGFRSGDKILQIDGKVFKPPTQAEKAAFDPLHFKADTIGQIYLIERTAGGNTFVQNLLIPSEERARVLVEFYSLTEPNSPTKTDVPFLKELSLNYGDLAFWSSSAYKEWWGKIIYVLVVMFIVTAVSNGVNITDGLDGLAAGTAAIVAGVLGIFAYASGHHIFADYLNISFIPYSGELFIFSAALIGACVGFLWYNTYPAQVFMGDTGSLALGGAIGVLALMVKKELLLPLICGVFFAESLSVIIQVSYFKYTKRRYGAGRRIFKMAPLHHHYELLGWHEAKIVTRFWIITILLEILAFATLKLR